MQCSLEGVLCKVCENEYFPDENGGCSYTENCEVSERGRCLKCKKDYISIGFETYLLDGIKICKSIYSDELKYCERINYENGLCLKCKNGYYLGSEDKKCTSISNCIESIYGVCKKCEKNYYLDKSSNSCKEQNGNNSTMFFLCQESNDGKKCHKCDIGYYFDEYGRCSKSNFCSKSDKLGKCLKCINGYYLTSFYQCTPEKNCYIGNKDFGVCESCEDEYYLDLKDRKCKSNQEDNNYKYCKSADKDCKNCIYGYYIGEDHKCSTSDYCSESDNGVCIKCIENYHLGLDKKCNNIEHCNYIHSYGGCKECKENYFYDRENKTCVKETDNFKNCGAGYAKYNCQECRNNYYLNQTDFKCYDNNDKNSEYYKCAIISNPGDICLLCIEGYYLGEKDNKCSKIEGCVLSENENKCIECKTNYVLNLLTNQCQDNEYIDEEQKKFYYRCKKTNFEGNKCQICDDGYTLDGNGLCVDNVHCTEIQDGVCQKCQNEFNSTFCLNKDFGCIEIYYDNCWKCDDNLDFYNCTKCFDGYEFIRNHKCLKIENE